MSGDDERTNHSREGESRENIPDFGDFIKPQETPEEDAPLDLSALLADIRRIPSNQKAQESSSKESSHSRETKQAPARPVAEDVAPARDTSENHVPRQTNAEEPVPVSIPAEKQAPHASEGNPVPERIHSGNPAPARRVPASVAAKRRAQIEAKRRKVKIMMAVTAVLVVAAIGTGIYYLVAGLSKDSKAKGTTSVPASSVSETTSLTSVSETATSQTETTTVPPTPTPDVTPFPAGGPDLSGYCVVIDAGHQAMPNREQEAMSSSMSGSKDKSAKGYNGVVTGTDESEINLQTALLLRAYLESLGCEVYITRETNDVDISNKERAEFAVSYDPDVYIRLFCNCANDSKTSGCSVIVPSSGKYADEVTTWGEKLGKAIAESCGSSYNGCRSSGNYTGLNWADSIPSFMVRMGYLSNSDEEANLLSEEYQYKICEGIAQFVSSMPKR